MFWTFCSFLRDDVGRPCRIEIILSISTAVTLLFYITFASPHIDVCLVTKGLLKIPNCSFCEGDVGGVLCLSFFCGSCLRSTDCWIILVIDIFH